MTKEIVLGDFRQFAEEEGLTILVDETNNVRVKVGTPKNHNYLAEVQVNSSTNAIEGIINPKTGETVNFGTSNTKRLSRVAAYKRGPKIVAPLWGAGQSVTVGDVRRLSSGKTICYQAITTVSALVNNAAGYAIGATVIAIDTNVGTITAGNAVRFANHSTVYSAQNTLSGAGNLTISPALTAAITDNLAIDGTLTGIIEPPLNGQTAIVGEINPATTLTVSAVGVGGPIGIGTEILTGATAGARISAYGTGTGGIGTYTLTGNAITVAAGTNIACLSNPTGRIITDGSASALEDYITKTASDTDATVEGKYVVNVSAGTAELVARYGFTRIPFSDAGFVIGTPVKFIKAKCGIDFATPFVIRSFDFRNRNSLLSTYDITGSITGTTLNITTNSNPIRVGTRLKNTNGVSTGAVVTALLTGFAGGAISGAGTATIAGHTGGDLSSRTISMGEPNPLDVTSAVYGYPLPDPVNDQVFRDFGIRTGMVRSSGSEQEVIVTDTAFGIEVNASSTGNIYQVMVNNQVVTGTPLKTNAANVQLLVYDFKGVLTRAVVTLRACQVAEASTACIHLTPMGRVEEATKSQDTLLCLGDSIWNTTSNSVLSPYDALSVNVKNNLGFEGVVCANGGGTGYVVPSVLYSIPQMVSDLTNQALFKSYNVTHVIVVASVNDNTQTAASVAAAALLTWRTLRSLLPNARITVFDAWYHDGGPLALAQVAALKQAFSSDWADPNSRFCTFHGADGATSLIFGTGNTSSTVTSAANGTRSKFIGPDLAHPSLAGVHELSDFISNSIIEAWGDSY